VDSRVVAAWGPAQRRCCGARGPWQRAVVKPTAPQTGGDELGILMAMRTGRCQETRA
jgi:hypothetical protein